MTCPTTRDEWVAFFESIPEDQWLATGQFRDGEGRCCARGHVYDHFRASSEGLMQLMLVLATPDQLELSMDVVAAVNDGKDARYQQPTPRARILAALRDLP